MHTLREGELDSRLRDRDRTIDDLNLRLRELTLTLRKQQATADAQALRISSLEDQILARVATPKRRVPLRTSPYFTTKEKAQARCPLRSVECTASIKAKNVNETKDLKAASTPMREVAASLRVLLLRSADDGTMRSDNRRLPPKFNQSPRGRQRSAARERKVRSIPLLGAADAAFSFSYELAR